MNIDQMVEQLLATSKPKPRASQIVIWKIKYGEEAAKEIVRQYHNRRIGKTAETR